MSFARSGSAIAATFHCLRKLCSAADFSSQKFTYLMADLMRRFSPLHRKSQPDRRNNMPLVGSRDSKPFFHDRLRGVGFRMHANGKGTIREVRVVVTYHALAEIGQAKIVHFPDALECFESLRERIEAAASEKFDLIDPEIQAFEGLPTVLLMTGDPI
jgi:hypothetical protein